MKQILLGSGSPYCSMNFGNIGSCMVVVYYDMYVLQHTHIYMFIHIYICVYINVYVHICTNSFAQCGYFLDYCYHFNGCCHKLCHIHNHMQAEHFLRSPSRKIQAPWLDLRFGNLRTHMRTRVGASVCACAVLTTVTV